MPSINPLNVRPIAVRCDLIAQAVLHVPEAEIAALRKSPGTLGGVAPTSSLLRHADEQTVVGLAAVLRAIGDNNLDPDGFRGWAVVAAPHSLGRAAFERAFPKFLDEGVWGVSPHLVPNHSLHSPSGAISQALKAHGPNLGVGGEREAFHLAASFLDDESMAGVWIVLSGRTPTPDGQGKYFARALALTSPHPGWQGKRLRILPDAIDLELAAESAGPSPHDGPITWRIDPPAVAGLPIHKPHHPARTGVSSPRET